LRIGVLPVLKNQAFLKLFLQEERPLMAYLLSATGDVHATDDLLQSVACILLEKLSEYDETRPFGGWAFGVARLEVIKWRQKACRLREVISEESMRLLAETAAEHGPETDQRYSFLRECLQKLGDAARRVMDMKYGQGRKIAEIAAATDRSVPAVEMILVRSRRNLRKCVEHKMSRFMENTR